ncbi:carbohydrate ABC transporter permease [Oceanivirga salmonicida]|uniref:carbohydrate ABC transporter permease n=1 Tax=Oceanivirga salmonicida TaxID=1769291 RepID=UPI000832C892|nr:sugar ABC transporter permease [Oceanivirga salmonicida]
MFNKKIRKNIINIMYIPALILFTIFVFYPFFRGILISFTNWNGFSQHYNSVGLENYKNIIISDLNVRMALKNTLIYGLGSTILQQILGLGYALFLNSDFRGRNFVRTVIYLPVMISGLIMGYMWYFIFKYDGTLAELFSIFGIKELNLLANGNISIFLLTFINSVQYCGISMLIYLAGLQNIPKMYYEASEIDGATSLQKFMYITIPMLRPAIITSFTINLIGGLKLFDVIKALTNGGPGYATHSLSTLIDKVYFGTQNAGYSAAIGVVLFMFILISSLITNQISKRGELDL